MDYYLLTDLAARVGYHLALSGAETFRVEETIRRIIGAYGIECETFSIPNCVMVSLEAANGKPLMVMKRVGFHGNDLESVEKLNALSRRICAETPDPSVAAQWLDETLKGRRHYSVPVYYLGNFCAAAGFCPVFGGTLRDSLFAGLLGLIIGFVSRQMDRRETNPFFSTIVEAFAMAVPAYLAAGFHLVDYIDFVIIGTLMILVPGLLITTSMRDIIYGDTNSGINRIVQVLLSAFAIALGTAAAWRVTSGVYGMTVASGSASYPAWAQAVMIFVACTGFFILFNVHDWGSILCALGGVFTWMTYLLCRDLGMSIYSMNFFAAVVSALYSELMARSRKYPVTSYLVISLLPLVPGAGIYYTMSLGLGGNLFAGAVTLTQPIYMGGKIRALNKMAEMGQEIASLMHDNAAREVVYSVDAAYWQVVSLGEKKKLAVSYIELLDTLHSNVEAMIRQGIATNSDLLNVEVKLNEANIDLTKVDNGLALSRMALAQICGMPMTQEFTLADEVSDHKSFGAMQPAAYTMQDVYNNRSDIKSLELAVKVYEQKQYEARSSMLPTVALVGTYGFSNPNIFNGFDKKFNGMFSVGAMVKIPLWHWGGNYYKYKAARSESIVKSLELEEAKEKIELQVSQASYKTAEAEKTLRTTESNLSKADENLRQAQLGYKEGVMTLDNVMAAQTAWLKANSENIDAEIDVQLCNVYLSKVTGTLKY